MYNFENKLVYIPASVMQAVKARGINLEQFGNGEYEALKHLSVTELGLLLACQEDPVITRALGQKGTFGFKWTSGDESFFRNPHQVAPLETTSDQLAEALGGDSNNNLCIEVVHLGPGVTGVVFGEGAYDALNKDNNVLTLLTQIVQSALLFEQPDRLAGRSMVSGVFERFLHVSAFANLKCRPPSPVYR